METKTPVKRYDWVNLKKEFFKGDYVSVSGFLKEKGIPDSVWNRKKTKGWTAQKEQYRQDALERGLEKSVDEIGLSIADTRRKQANLARFMQLKGEAALQGIDPDIVGVDDARKLVVAGMREERTALGMDSVKSPHLTQVNINLPPTKFDNFIEGASYEDLIQFLADIKRERARYSLPESVSAGAKEVQIREA